MIIIEGPDGAGKTTLIEELRKELHLTVAERVVSKEAKAMTDLVKWTEDNVAKGFQFQIFDRHRLISEPIYGPILRDKPQPGFGDIQWFHRQIWQFYNVVKPVIIYCLPPWPKVEVNVRDDPNNKVVQSQIHSIYSLYLSKAATDIATYDRAVIYDYTQPYTKTRAILAAVEAMKGTEYDSTRRVSIGG